MKKFTYIILSNHQLYEKYNNKSYLVFDDENVEWKVYPNVSGYWNEFEYHAIYNYKTLMSKLYQIMNFTKSNPCDYNKERFLIYSTLYYQLDMGETLFVRYE
jgi:hypothetical protein